MEIIHRQSPISNLQSLWAHAGHYLALAEQAEPHLIGPDQSTWLDRLGRDHDNLRAALRWALARGKVEIALRLGNALWQFWFMRDHLSEGRRRLDRALAISEPSAIPNGHDVYNTQYAVRNTQHTITLRAKALYAAGTLAYYQDDRGQAVSLFEESLALFRELGDKQGIATALTGLGKGICAQGQLTAARTLLEEGLTLHRELGDRSGIADALHGLGRVAFAQGDYGAAHSLMEESLALRRALGHKWGVAGSLIFAATVALYHGDYGAARSLVEEILSQSRGFGNRSGIAMARGLLRGILLEQSDPSTDSGQGLAAARALLEEARAIHKEFGTRRGISICLIRLGDVALRAGDHRAARALYEEGLGVARELSDPQYIAFCISPRTVHGHLHSIYSKLGVHSRTAATRYAIDHNLV